MAKKTQKTAAKSTTATVAALAAKAGATTKSVAATPAPAPAAKPAVAKAGIPEGGKITVLVSANPKRPGSKAHGKFALYAKPGVKTVADFIKAMVEIKYPRRRAMSNLRWDTAHGFVKIDGYTPPSIAEVKAEGERA